LGTNLIHQYQQQDINMQNPISDFSKEMQAYVAELLEQRYGHAVDLQLADIEVQLNPLDEELTLCPALFWAERNANFVVYKAGEYTFRTQFFYSPDEQFGTGIDEFHDLEKCVTAVLQVQADQERVTILRSTTATEFS
jgi:hypothetical protein